jgi:hypothetical protein
MGELPFILLIAFFQSLDSIVSGREPMTISPPESGPD